MRKIFFPLAIIVLIIILGWSFWALINPVPENHVSVIENKSDIEVFLPQPNEIISSPLKITGVVNGNGWSGFEGQVGTVKLINSDTPELADPKELATGFLEATTEWTNLPTHFQAYLNFTSPGKCPLDYCRGDLVFHNENPSGDPVRDKTFVLPIKFK